MKTYTRSHHLHDKHSKRDIRTQLCQPQHFPCNTTETCDKTFDTVKNLATHIKNEHSKIPSNNCEKCSKSFYTTYALEMHSSRSHCTKHLFKCDQCSKKFVSSNKFKIHQRRHLKVNMNEDAVRSECDLCGLKFGSASSMQNHLQEIHVPIQSVKESNLL